jgi:hypothetical protein
MLILNPLEKLHKKQKSYQRKMTEKRSFLLLLCTVVRSFQPIIFRG